MSNGINFYSKKFETFSKACSQLGGLERVVKLPDNSNIILKRYKSLSIHNRTELVIAKKILEIYLSKRIAHHKEEAELLKSVFTCFIDASKSFSSFLHTHKDFPTAFFAAIKYSLAIQHETDELSEEEMIKITREYENQKSCPQIELQKLFIGTLITHLLEKSQLNSHKSDFASLCFVIIKKLEIPNIPNEILKKIIEGANFSRGFFCRGTDKTRRALELSELSSNSSEYKL